MSTKINLAEFKQYQLEVDQLLAVKGGCGGSGSSSSSTSCVSSQSDPDSCGGDSDGR